MDHIGSPSVKSVVQRPYERADILLYSLKFAATTCLNPMFGSRFFKRAFFLAGVSRQVHCWFYVTSIRVQLFIVNNGFKVEST